MPIKPSSIKYLDPDQVSSVIGNAKCLRDKAVLAVIYNCGLRRSESELLCRDDFIQKRGVGGMLKVKRVKKDGFYEHEIPLWRRTSRLLEKYLATRTDHFDTLFLGRTGYPLSGQMVYYIFKEAAEKAGLPVPLLHPHVLRHSIAVHLRNMGLSIDEIKEHLGHDSIDSTLIYAKVLTPLKTRAAMLAEASHHIANF